VSSLWLREDLARGWAGRDPFAVAAAQSGELLKQKDARRTLRFTLGECTYVLKHHAGVGWREILKNLLGLQWPVLDAGPEWRAAQRLAAAGVPSLVLAGYGARGLNPARRCSFTVCEDLGARISLERLCAAWRQAPPPSARKRLLIAQVATLARAMHAAGVNHRDFYLCHLLLDEASWHAARVADDIDLRIIDLHRAQCRARVPAGRRARDLAALAFSARDIGLTRTDRLRFVREYAGGDLRVALGHRALWRAVRRRAARLIARSCRISR
jgi:heptose I phosphotransferase